MSRKMNRQNSNAAITTTHSALTDNGHDTVANQTTLNFSDIESTLRKFKGDGTTSVHLFLNDFEKAAIAFNWNNIQKFVFCKRLLSDIAKLFIECEIRPITYRELKTELINEYGENDCSANIHKKLQQRKKMKHESLLEYLYTMIEIASQGDIGEKSIIAYVIDGINDVPSHKTMLYGANSIKEFKNKLNDYQTFKGSIAQQHSSEYNIENKKFKEKNNKKRCYNCGNFDHEFHSCPSKANGPKCFKCNNFGHKAANCTKHATAPTTMNVNSQLLQNYMFIKINDVTLKGLIDTGSQHCLIKYHLISDIRPLELEYDTRINVAGLVSSTFTKGTCKVTVELGTVVMNEVKFHILQANPVAPDVIIGMDLLKHLKVTMNGGKLTIEPKEIAIDDYTLAEEVTNPAPCFLATIEDVFEVKQNEFQPDMSHITNKTIVTEIKSLIASYSPQNPPASPIQLKIMIIDEVPVYQRPRRFPPTEQKIIDGQIEEWLKTGIIVPSCSNYACNVVLIKKKDGSHRLCIDFRALNKKILREHFPLPIIEDQIDKLCDADFYSTLDLENAFFHVDVEETSRKYTSFVTQHGQFEFTKVPFGLSNSPSIFQKYICYIFKELIRRNVVIIYIDDIVIPSKGVTEGLVRLKEAIQVAETNGLKIKWRKCQLLKSKIEYLGFCVERGCVSPCDEKIKAVVNFPIPSNVKKLQSFLGLTNYFRRFIPCFATKTKPLTEFLKKECKFPLTDQEHAAINTLKQDLISKPVLKIFRYGAVTELHTDACKEGYGGVLLQKDSDDGALHPVYYFSKKTTSAEEKYTSYELEVLAIIHAVKKFRVYLIGQQFRIVTDCKAFECTMRKRDLTTRVARWALLLEEFNYVLEHRSGNKMRHVDALSRNAVFCTVSNSQFLNKLITAQKADDRLVAIMEILKEKSYKNYVLYNGILCKHLNDAMLMVVPEGMKNNIIKEVHEKGHFHFQKMKAIIEKEFYIDNLQQRIQNHIRNCVPCILAERKRGKTECLLNPIPKGELPLEVLHIDHLGPMQATKKGYRYILAIIDGFTKFSWLFPTKSLSSQETIQKILIMAETFGFPARLIADNGAAFTANEFKQFCLEKNVKLTHTTVGVPRGNGQVERLHSIVIGILTKLSIDDPDKWYSHVKPVQNLLNATYQRAIKMSPFKLLTGTEMRTNLTPELLTMVEEETIVEFDESRNLLRQSAKQQINELQNENKRAYDAKRKRAHQYSSGDLVAIKKMQFGVAQKIRPKFFGPYCVTEVKGYDRYRVKKVGETEGPRETETSADNMKPWQECDDEIIYNEDSSSE